MLYNDAVKDTFLKTKRKVLLKLFQLWTYQNWNNDPDREKIWDNVNGYVRTKK